MNSPHLHPLVSVSQHSRSEPQHWQTAFCRRSACNAAPHRSLHAVWCSDHSSRVFGAATCCPLPHSAPLLCTVSAGTRMERKTRCSLSRPASKLCQAQQPVPEPGARTGQWPPCSCPLPALSLSWLVPMRHRQLLPPAPILCLGPASSSGPGSAGTRQDLLTPLVASRPPHPHCCGEQWEEVVVRSSGEKQW